MVVSTPEGERGPKQVKTVRVKKENEKKNIVDV